MNFVVKDIKTLIFIVSDESIDDHLAYQLSDSYTLISIDRSRERERERERENRTVG